MLANLDDPYTRFLDPKEFDADRHLRRTDRCRHPDLPGQDTKILVVSPIEHTGIPGWRSAQGRDRLDRWEVHQGDDHRRCGEADPGRKAPKSFGLRRKGEVLTVLGGHALRFRLWTVDTTKNVWPRSATSANSSMPTPPAKCRRRSTRPKVRMCSMRNPGGLLEASIDIARQWLDKAPSSTPKHGMAFRTCAGQAVH